MNEKNDQFYRALEELSALSDQEGTPAFVREARERCIEASKKCDEYFEAENDPKRARELMWSPVVARILVEQAQEALAEYGVAIVEHKMGRVE
jgi:hypothetical protein